MFGFGNDDVHETQSSHSERQARKAGRDQWCPGSRLFPAPLRLCVNCALLRGQGLVVFKRRRNGSLSPTEATGRFGRYSRLDAAFATCYTDTMKSNATFKLRLVCLVAIVGAAGLCVRAQSPTPSPAATPPPSDIFLIEVSVKHQALVFGEP